MFRCYVVQAAGNQSEFTNHYIVPTASVPRNYIPAQGTKLYHFSSLYVCDLITLRAVMSPTGSGQVGLDGCPDNPAGTAPRKGVMEFDDDESSEDQISDVRRRSGQDPVREGK